MGDFYEMFYEDAVTASAVLDLTLTSRSKDVSGAEIPMCGVPYHAADSYLSRLVKRGFRVALCEQVEDPKKAKGLVRREVVRVVSPGTLADTNNLDAREPVFLVAIAPMIHKDVKSFGIATADLSTGEFLVSEHTGTDSQHSVIDELAAIGPRELLVPSNFDTASIPELADSNIPTTLGESRTFELDEATRTLKEQFRINSLDGLGLKGSEHSAAIAAAGGLLEYLRRTQKADLAHFRGLEFRLRSDHLIVDPSTFKHLEILRGTDGDRANSVLAKLDETQTAMGGRLLRAWLLRPLASSGAIRDRLDSVEEFTFETVTRSKVREALRNVLDLERLVSRAVLGTAGPRDMAALASSIAVIPLLCELTNGLRAQLTRSLLNGIDDISDVRDEIQATLVDNPPALARDGRFVRDGVDSELDELRSVSSDAKHAIAAMEKAERERTGIASLKIKFNRIFGYYIEISKSNLHAVPDDYQRKQTIANGERFSTPALKEFEHKALGADGLISEREQEIFNVLRTNVTSAAHRIKDSARVLASLDVVSALAEIATQRNYTKPHIHDGSELIIIDARHPVVECHRETFVPNDVTLNDVDQQLVVLTGPNMGGKSTYLRQTAILVLMAHAGSFVPAREATIPVVDQIFARVGAADNIARGQSTFMVEMEETARILHLATSRSLVILDEIGRGTATYDGLSIAWAVAEHLVTDAHARPKTLFATHYHELTDLADAHQGVINQHVVAREWQDDIIFLHQVLPGRSDRSYGIQVAKLAGMPPATIASARTILAGLEGDELSRGGRPSFSGASQKPREQLGLFQAPRDAHSRIANRLNKTDIERMTPLDALSLLAELKQELEN